MRCKWKLLVVTSGEICKSKGSDSLPVPFLPHSPPSCFLPGTYSSIAKLVAEAIAKERRSRKTKRPAFLMTTESSTSSVPQPLPLAFQLQRNNLDLFMH